MNAPTGLVLIIAAIHLHSPTGAAQTQDTSLPPPSGEHRKSLARVFIGRLAEHNWFGHAVDARGFAIEFNRHDEFAEALKRLWYEKVPASVEHITFGANEWGEDIAASARTDGGIHVRFASEPAERGFAQRMESLIKWICTAENYEAAAEIKKHFLAREFTGDEAMDRFLMIDFLIAVEVGKVRDGIWKDYCQAAGVPEDQRGQWKGAEDGTLTYEAWRRTERAADRERQWKRLMDSWILEAVPQEPMRPAQKEEQ